MNAFFLISPYERGAAKYILVFNIIEMKVKAINFKLNYSWNLMKVTHLFKINIFILSLDMPSQSHENKNYRQKIIV